MNIFGFLIAALPAIFIALLFGLAVFMVLFMTWVRQSKVVGEGYDRETVRYTDKSNATLSVLAGVVVFLLIFGVAALFSSFTTIEAGNVGLVKRFGRLTSVVFGPGLNWKTPFVESVEIVDTTQQAYEASHHPDTSKATWTDFPITSQTQDGQTVTVTFTTIFRIPDGEAAVAIRQNIGPIEEVVENVVKANSRSATRNIIKEFKAEEIYTGNIIEYQDAVREELVSKFAIEGYGLVLSDFLVRNTSFEEEYTNSIEAKQIEAERVIKEQYAAEAAKFEAQKVAELAKGDAQAAIERATGEAESIRIRAAANADAVEIDAEAQAFAIEEMGKALDKYESVLSLRFIENLNDKTLFLPSNGIEFFLPLENPQLTE